MQVLCFKTVIYIVTSQKRRDEMDRMEKEKQAEIRSYKGLMVSEKMTSNKDIASKGKSLQELEEDFMWSHPKGFGMCIIAIQKDLVLC